MYAQTHLYICDIFICLDFGPSGVRALPLGVAAELSVHYFWDYFSFSPPHTFLPEGVIVGLQNFV